MNNIWYKLILFSLLLMLIFTPFAGFAPLLLVILVAGTYWFFSSLIRVLILGDTDKETQERDIDLAND